MYNLFNITIQVQYCDITRFMALLNRHHKVSQSTPFFMHCKTITILFVQDMLCIEVIITLISCIRILGCTQQKKPIPKTKMYHYNFFHTTISMAGRKWDFCIILFNFVHRVKSEKLCWVGLLNVSCTMHDAQLFVLQKNYYYHNNYK